MLAPMARTSTSTCTARGTHEGVEWSCERPAVARGLCDGHRKQAFRARPLSPLHDLRTAGQTVQVFITLTAAERAQLGEDPGARAGAIVRATLAAERRKRKAAAAKVQLGLRLLPPRRRSGGRSRPE
jgi:hypothetical protein